MGLRVLVCGGRSYGDRETLYRVLHTIAFSKGIDRIIHGGASGADTLAGDWALETCTRSASYGADWKKYGRSAGPIRNEAMIQDGKPDVIVAFPGGKGTADMTRRGRAWGVGIVFVGPQGKVSLRGRAIRMLFDTFFPGVRTAGWKKPEGGGT